MEIRASSGHPAGGRSRRRARRVVLWACLVLLGGPPSEGLAVPVAQSTAAPSGEAERRATPPPATAEASAAQPPLALPDASRASLDPGAVRKAIDQLEVRQAAGRQVAPAADQLFRELDDALWSMHRSVRAAAAASASDVFQRHARVVALYDERDRLFEFVSPALRDQVFGGGPVGREAVRHEFAYLQTRLLTQLHIIRQGTRQLTSNLSESPLKTTWGALQVLLAVVLFRSWRRWSGRGLKDTTQKLLAIRPRQASNIRLARLLWYLQRIEGPLSWLVLILVLERLVSPRGFEELTSLVYTVLIWIFVARLVVQLIDALAARGVGGLRSARAGLRLRSLRLVAGWAVLLGLGYSLVTRYTGHGAILAWATRLSLLLSLPAAVLLAGWWRDEIGDRLDELAPELAWARRFAAAKRRGLWSYPMTVVGAAYLTWVATLDGLVRRLSNWDLGRRILTVLVRREVERDGLRTRDQEGEPIADELVERLLATEDVRLDSVAKAERATLTAALSARLGGGYVLLGERGLGKSVFLARLGGELGEGIRTVACPPSGYAGLEDALAAEFGVGGGGPERAEQIAAAIDAAGVHAIAVDDAHRLSRPWMGGQQGLESLVALDAMIAAPVSWVLAIDDAAWRYISLARGERALFQQVVSLPPWTEEALGFLLEGRAKACGLALDYGRLVLPRQLDAGEHDSLAERNRFGYARILWELADGNPDVALRIFVRSLYQAADGSIVVQLPQSVYSAALNDAAVETLLVLRVVVQCEVARLEDIVRSLRISEARALATIRFCRQNQWLEIVDGGWRIEWGWFRSITRTLVRRNLMAR